MGGDANLLRSVVDTLIKEGPARVQGIQQAIAEGDAKKLRLDAHTLKSALRYFGVESLADQAQRLEELAATATTQVEPGELDRLEAGVAEVVQQLQTFRRRPPSSLP